MDPGTTGASRTRIVRAPQKLQGNIITNYAEPKLAETVTPHPKALNPLDKTFLHFEKRKPKPHETLEALSAYTPQAPKPCIALARIVC